MSFARLTIPSQEAAASLKRVTYAAPTRADGTNTLVAGISRMEESPDAVRPAAGISRTGLQSSGLDTVPEGTSSGVAANESTRETEARANEDLLTDLVRWLRLRYWDGAAWTDGWTNSAPPSGIEITISTDVPSGETASDATGTDGAEIFRRVVFLTTGIALRRPEVDGLRAVLSNGTP